MTPSIPQGVALEFQSIDRFLYRVADLHDLTNVDSETEARLDACHIYLLVKRPRLSLVPGSLFANDERVQFDVSWRAAGIDHSKPVALPRSSFPAEEKIFEVGDYPHRELISRREDGSLFAITLLANHAHVLLLPDEVKDLEVLYVGKGLRRSAQDRLKNHATLQRVLADALSKDPDSEIFALVYAFQERRHGMFENLAAARATGAVQRAADLRLSLDDQIALIEACCVAYFQTNRYNIHYLDFPRQDSPRLGPLRAAGVTSIVVQLDQTNIGAVRIFSHERAPESTHYIVTPLPDRRL